MHVSIFQFADDNVFFNKASLENIITIKSVLRCFELASDLKINFHKSKIGKLGINEYDMEMFSKVLNCSLMIVSFKYLGMMVGGNPKKQEL